MKNNLRTTESGTLVCLFRQSNHSAPGRSFLKILLYMKFTLLLLCLSFLQSYGKVFSQDIPVSLNMKNSNISRVLSKIEKKTDYRFLYNVKEIGEAEKVDARFENVKLEDVLNHLMAHTGLSYTLLSDKLIVIAPKNKELFIHEVSGTVTDSSGNPLVGVSIHVKGTSLGAVTDANGNFTLQVEDSAVLVVSYLGFQTKEISVGDQTNLEITLSSASTELNQVVVVGYGTQRKIDVTGAVGQVNGEDISKQASVNAASALQGKVAGVTVINSGSPGSSPQVNIRGVGTVYGSSNPLYIVDGVWYNDISFLNPQDIASMSVLKDASSQSIYGIRAANGVILITTKKGKEGELTINYNGYVGFQQATNKVNMANAQQYASLLNQKLDSTVIDPGIDHSTNWYDVILQPALVHSHEISARGGTEKGTYSLSLGYLDQEGIVKGNDYQRITGRFSNDWQLKPALKIGYNLTMYGFQSDDIPMSAVYQSYVAPPVVPVKNPDGSYGDAADYPTGNFSNPQATLDFYNQITKGVRLTGNVYLDLHFLQHFTFHTSFGGEYGENEIRNYAPAYNATSVQHRDVSVLTKRRDETRNWIVENTLTYDNTFDDAHHLKVLIGQTAQRYKNGFITGTAENVPGEDEGQFYLDLGDIDSRTVDDGGDLFTTMSYFGRINYSYADRYLFMFSMRADGSSKFPPGNRWGYFPAVGAGWVISGESFMQNQNIFDFLKLRGSWGKIGNASIPTNITNVLINNQPQFTAIFGADQLPHTGASITALVPPTLVWERGVGTNVGLEMQFLDSRLHFTTNFYNRETKHAIFDIQIPETLGTSPNSLLGNNADFLNRGFEFILGWQNDASKKFHYSLNGNFSINHNEVRSISTGDVPLYSGALPVGGFFTTRTVTGQPIGQFYGLVVDGIFQDADEIAQSVQPNAQPGDFKYKDVNEDGTINDKDRVVLGNAHPKYTYGLSTYWQYGNFDLQVDFQGVFGVDIYNGNTNTRYGNENYTEQFYKKRWHGPGTSNTYPAPRLNGENLKPNSWYVWDGSYFRIRNIQLGYTLPESLLSRWNMKQVRFYINAQNPFNFFSYNGFSPEIGAPSSGANKGNPTDAGIDRQVYPMYATYNFGVNISF